MSKFFALALCDAYLAIGAPGRLIICKLDGEHAGRMVIDHMFKDPYARIEQLAFSPDGTDLIAIMKSRSTGNSTKLETLAMSTTKFPQPTLEVNSNANLTVSLDNLNVGGPLLFRSDWDEHTIPIGMAFSGDGTKVAIYTNWTAAKAGIQLLRKIESKWEFWGKFHRVPVFREDDRYEWQGVGLTGISLYVLLSSWFNFSYQQNTCLALSIASHDDVTPDCYQIVETDGGNILTPAVEGKIANNGTKNIAICVSQLHREVVLLDAKGTAFFGKWIYIILGNIQIKLLGTSLKPVKLSTKATENQQHITLRFSENDDRLLLISNQVQSSYWDSDIQGKIEIHNMRQ